MKIKSKKLAYVVLGGLLQMGLLMSCTDDSQELNDVIQSEEEVVVPESDNLTAANCDQVMKTWGGFGGTGTDFNVGVNSMIDDRSCAYNYTQGTYGSSYNWGAYRIAAPDVNGTL